MKPLSLTKPHIIVMLGIPSSGKTFFAEQFATTFHTPFIHYAKLAKLSGLSSTGIHKIVAYQLRELLKTKQSIIIEGFAESRADRTALTKRAHSAGYEVLYVWVQTDPNAAMQRAVRSLAQEGKRTMSARQYEQQANTFVMPLATDSVAVISGKHTFASQVKTVLNKLTAPRAEAASRTTPARRTVSEPKTKTATKSTAKPTPKSRGRRSVTVE